MRSVCLRRHPAVAYLFLVRPMRTRLVSLILLGCAYVVGAHAETDVLQSKVDAYLDKVGPILAPGIDARTGKASRAWERQKNVFISNSWTSA